MVCTNTGNRLYSDYVELQARGDGGVLEWMYVPSKNGVKVIGAAVYVNAWSPEDMTLQTPSCSSFLVGEACNVQVALTKFEKSHRLCLTECQFSELSDGDKGLMINAEITLYLRTLLPLMYADMIANGTNVLAGGATPTEAQMRTAILSALTSIASFGGTPGAIILDTTYSGTALGGLAAMVQPPTMLRVKDGYGPNSIGNLSGYEIFATPTSLATAAATPVQVAAIVFARLGFAYAFSGDTPEMGFNFVPLEPDFNGTNSLVSRACLAYKTINANLVYYITCA